MESPDSCGNGFRDCHRVFEASKRDLSYEAVAEGASRGCDGTFHFSGELKNLVVEFSAVVVELQHHSRMNACTVIEEIGAERFVEEDRVQRG